MENKAFQTPILFLIFNRPDTTQKVFNQIRNIKPKQLFICADGPRNHVENDYKICMQARRIVKQIDWECEVKTLFREKNLGCGRSISGAISWFFDHVEQGIILEDDCVPDITFFGFCEKLLKRYENEEEVMMVTGTNYFFNRIKKDFDYFFTRYYPVWGWATWKRAWEKYDFEIMDWKMKKPEMLSRLKRVFKHRHVVNYWAENFDMIVNKKIDSWAFQWSYNCIFNNGFCAMPVHNLVSNIGYIGVHSTGNSPVLNMPRKQVDIKTLQGPNKVICDKELTRKIYQINNVIKPFSFKVFTKNILRKAYHSLRG